MQCSCELAVTTQGRLLHRIWSSVCGKYLELTYGGLTRGEGGGSELCLLSAPVISGGRSPAKP